MSLLGQGYKIRSLSSKHCVDMLVYRARQICDQIQDNLSLINTVKTALWARLVGIRCLGVVSKGP